MNIIIFVAATAIYLIPSIVAIERGHRNAGAIIVLNIVLGRTFLGWIVVWASTANVKTKEERGQNREAATTGTGRYCHTSRPNDRIAAADNNDQA